MSSTRNGKLHVVMLPWCAFGHTIPFLELSKSLATAGVSVSFVSTPRNIQRLPKLPPHLEALVTLVELPMPSLEDGTLLPPGAEATVDLPTYDAIQHLKTAYDLLHKPFHELVAAVKPDWIIADVLPHWAADVSVELGVPLVVFSIFPAHTLLFFGPPEYLAGEGQRRVRGSPESLTHPPEWVGSLSPFAFRSFEAEGLYVGLFGGNASGISDAGRFAKMLMASRAVAVRTCSEIEEKYLNPYAKLIGRDVIPVGLLPRTQKEAVRTGSANGGWESVGLLPRTQKEAGRTGNAEGEWESVELLPRTQKEDVRTGNAEGEELLPQTQKIAVITRSAEEGQESVEMLPRTQKEAVRTGSGDGGRESVEMLPRTQKEAVRTGSGDGGRESVELLPRTLKEAVRTGSAEGGRESVKLLPRTQTEAVRTGSEDGGWEWDKTFKWLDDQRNRSVIFVIFGSEVKFTKEQVSEIARGLELSELPFLWAMRRPSWAEGDADTLPPGFGRRMAGRGVVTMGWAPQMEIISHRAIGGCMIQSGWSSVIETLQFGHCLVLLPFIIDQGLIARFLVDMGVAVEVRRDEDGSFVGGDIADCLRLVMVEEAGEAARVKAREAGAVFGDIEHQQRFVNEFVEYLKHGSS